MTIQGQNVVITGAAGGIGRACVRRFIAAGARVVLSDIDSDALQRAADELALVPGQASLQVCDIASYSQCHALVRAAEAFFGAPLDVFLANAGRPYSGLLLEAREEDIRCVIDVNVTGTLFSAQAALQSLVRGRNASLLLTGSLQSITGRAQRSVYTASKHAIAGMVKSLALEMGPHGVRVNGIAPTILDTAFLREAYEKVGTPVESGLRQAAAGLPLGRIPVTDDFADAAVFLASESARSITGQMMVIDCGASAGKF
jgi:3-oxoacyl-[acyl-carrier protein] reductase